MKVVDKCPGCGLEVVFDPEFSEGFLCPRCNHPFGAGGNMAPLISLLPVDPSDGLSPYNLWEGIHTLGRQSMRSNATVQLPVYDGFMSKVHCRITVKKADGEPEATLSDAGSANGTSLNDRRLTGFEEAKMADNDILQLGNTSFRIRFNKA